MPSNRLGAHREALHGAVAPILPGRTHPCPPTVNHRWVAPYIWIDQPTVAEVTIGERTRVAEATFPIWVVYDGSVAAQVNGLDELVSRVWDAVASVGNPTLARPNVVVEAPNLRATVIEVAVTTTAVTLCLPDYQALDVVDATEDVVFTPTEPTRIPGG